MRTRQPGAVCRVGVDFGNATRLRFDASLRLDLRNCRIDARAGDDGHRAALDGVDSNTIRLNAVRGAPRHAAISDLLSARGCAARSDERCRDPGIAVGSTSVECYQTVRSDARRSASLGCRRHDDPGLCHQRCDRRPVDSQVGDSRRGPVGRRGTNAGRGLRNPRASRRRRVSVGQHADRVWHLASVDRDAS